MVRDKEASQAKTDDPSAGGSDLVFTSQNVVRKRLGSGM